MERPRVIACSADLADSTNISGFAKAFGEFPGFGWFEHSSRPTGSLLPQQITEFTNSGLVVGLATVNMASEPEKEFLGYWGACSTYGSFSYLKYGPMRLFSQLAQDCPLKVGKVIWVVGHSGPETAEDSRTHFGIFAPGVTQLFPEGRVINLHPWETNEVAPALAAALRTDVPIVALHLTRPAVAIPDRAKLGVPSHFDAAKGAYVIKPHDEKRPKQGTLIVQGTLGIGTAILETAALSFLGLGAQPPTAEWGAMLAAERNQVFTAPHLVFFPGLAIMINVLGFNLLGDGLRDALDPRLRR